MPGRTPTSPDATLINEDEVALLAALVRPYTSRTALCDALALAGVRNPNGSRVSVEQLRPHLDALEARGVLQRTSATTTYIVFNPERRWSVLRAGHARGSLGTVYSLLSEATAHVYAERRRLAELLADAAAVQIALVMGEPALAQRWFWMGLGYDDRPARVAAFAFEIFGAELDLSWLSFLEGRALTLCVGNVVSAALAELAPISPQVLTAALVSDSAPLRGRAARVALLRGQGPPLDHIQLGKVARAEAELVGAMLRGDYRDALQHVDIVNGKDPEKPRAPAP